MDIIFVRFESQVVARMDGGACARHEIVGVVTEIGVDVECFKVGQHVGVGCMVRSCHACDSCQLGVEQYCPKVVWTYNSIDTADGTLTQGGYSAVMVCNQR